MAMCPQCHQTWTIDAPSLNHVNLLKLSEAALWDFPTLPTHFQKTTKLKMTTPRCFPGQEIR